MGDVTNIKHCKLMRRKDLVRNMRRFQKVLQRLLQCEKKEALKCNFRGLILVLIKLVAKLAIKREFLIVQ